MILQEESDIKSDEREEFLFEQCVLTSVNKSGTLVHKCLRIELLKMPVATTKWITRWDLKFLTYFYGYLHAGQGNLSKYRNQVK